MERRRAHLIDKEMRISIRKNLPLEAQSLSDKEHAELAMLMEISRKHYGL